MSLNPTNRTVTVLNPEGLHARPADLIVRTANRFDATVRILRDGESVDCKSILSLLTLGAAQGTVLELSAEGHDAELVLDAIGQLFDSGFDDPAAVQDGQVEDAESTVDS